MQEKGDVSATMHDNISGVTDNREGPNQRQACVVVAAVDCEQGAAPNMCT